MKFAARMVTLSLLLLPMNAYSQPRAVFGAGLVSCGEWQQARTKNNTATTYQLQAWVDDFLSGYNIASPDKDYLSTKPSSVAMYAWLDNYCAAHPLDAIVTAVFQLKDELAARSK